MVKKTTYSGLPLLVVLVGGLLACPETVIGATAQGAGTDATSIRITAKIMTSDPEQNLAVFEGDVLARTNDVSVMAARMVVRYAGASGAIDVIECEGDVKVVQGEKTIVSDRARYTEQDNMIEFTGNPKIFQGTTMISGSRIRYFPGTDETEVADGNVIINR